MQRIVITRIEHNKKQYIIYLLLDENRKVVDLQMFEPQEDSLLNNIYSAYVEKIVPGIQAAFVRISNGQKCFLPLNDIKNPVFSKKQSEKKSICEGDELLVQVIKDAVKTKDPVVSTKLTLHGHFCFLTTGNLTIGVSRKITAECSEKLLALGKHLCFDHEKKGYGLVFRTNAENASANDLEADVRKLVQKLDEIKVNGIHRTQGTLIYRNISGYLERLKRLPMKDVDIVFTDQQDIYDEIHAYLPELNNLKLYDDPDVSLSTLYNIRGFMEQLTSSRVWLKSGANIIIETLETLTVIDVNTGKNQSRSQNVLLMVNIEAAKEIARQLRLRNISGMIIIDFINVKSLEQKDELIKVMRQELKKDSVPAQVIDITKLGLVELTRKKIYKSLHEILR